jgi:hypothetical protein
MMRLFGLFAVALAAIGLTGSAGAQSAPKGSVDYADPAHWLCKPGDEAKCEDGLDAIAVDASGQRTPLPPFKAVEDPKVDCFFIYPTVSEEPSTYADLTPSPEIARDAHGQVGRYGQVCRLFVPLYRQITLTELQHHASGKTFMQLTDVPYADVKAAWNYYLAHENSGRGVILVGHSQGTILLQRLLQEEIDRKPAEKLLVAAHLGGDPGLGVKPGSDRGGTFQSIRTCRSADQTDCVVVWATYAVDDKISPRIFGNPPGPGQAAACVNPAAPGGGRAMLHGYIRKPAEAPAGDPPYVEMVGQISAECVSDSQGSVLRVTIEPGRFSDRLAGFFKLSANPGWGLHGLDFSLPQGDLVDLAGREAASWEQQHPQK